MGLYFHPATALYLRTEGDVTGFYLDDIRVYESSALALERVETEVYEGDIYGTVKVDAISLYSIMICNAEHLTQIWFMLRRQKATAVTPSAIVFDHLCQTASYKL